MTIDQTPVTGTEQDPTTPQISPAEEPQAPAAPEEPQAPSAQQTPSVPPAPATPDYKEKFKHSSSEALIQKARAEMFENRLNQITAQDAPTEAEIRTAYPEWDGYDAFTKGVLTNQMALKKNQERTSMLLVDMMADQKWQEDLKHLAKNPRYKTLRDDPEFEAFVMKPKHKGLDIETLARAYLFEETPDEVPPTPTPAPTDPGLDMGQGGPRTAEKPKFSPEETAQIMTNDPRRYRELLVSGEISLE